MARLTWAKKLNNRLKRNWGVEIDFSKCFQASACGKRTVYDHGTEHPISDDRWHRIYDLLLPATKRDSIAINYHIKYDWGSEEDYQYCLRHETEYYGYCYGFVDIDVTTPKGRNKIRIDSRYA